MKINNKIELKWKNSKFLNLFLRRDKKSVYQCQKNSYDNNYGKYIIWLYKIYTINIDNFLNIINKWLKHYIFRKI